MDKGKVCIHNGILLSLEKEGGMSFVTIWMNLGDTVLNEVSQTKRKKIT